ncbi:hypothetical protein MMC32_004760 [Xylographa parallela]|nr:hypothetical protein [Xylographa parallela]
MVFVTDFEDELGDPVPLTMGSNAWESLPSPQNGMDLFKAIRVVGERYLATIDQQRSYFSASVMATAFHILLQPWSADQDAVKQAVAAGQRPVDGSSRSTERSVGG